MRHNVSKFTEIDPKFVQKVLESFYVDGFVSGESDTEKAFDFFDKTKGRMAEGGFKLRKWVTNSKELKEKIDLHEKVQGNGDNVVNDHLLYEYRDLFIDMDVRNNRSELAIANRHQERSNFTR